MAQVNTHLVFRGATGWTAKADGESIETGDILIASNGSGPSSLPAKIEDYLKVKKADASGDDAKVIGVALNDADDGEFVQLARSGGFVGWFECDGAVSAGALVKADAASGGQKKVKAWVAGTDTADKILGRALVGAANGHYALIEVF